MHIVFGPVPSRRLGSSLGINHIPPKYCTYACIYCQVGKTNHLTTLRRKFYTPDEIIRQVEVKIAECSRAGRAIDYISLVPDGEPTLDIHLGELIMRLKAFKTPVAVISNASLISQRDVQKDLIHADWISVKVDSVCHDTWRKINRPFHSLSIENILEGMIHFKRHFRGVLVTETMLISGVNDVFTEIDPVTEFLVKLKPTKAYLGIPIRPPAEVGVKPPLPERQMSIFKRMKAKAPFVDTLWDSESVDFHSTGNFIEDVLSIVSVHPIREVALWQMASKAGIDWQVVDGLVNAGSIKRVFYRNEFFYLKNTHNS